MSILSTIAPDLPDVFQVLIDQYGFVLKVENEYQLVLRSRHCIIEIAFEQHGPGFAVDLASSQNGQDRYSYFLVMTMRRSDYRQSTRRYDHSQLDDENLRLDLRELCDNVIRYCPDLLSGNFADIRRQGYHEFASYIQTRMPEVLNMPADDPIKAKFWQGDLTWARDLRDREQQDRLTD